MHWAAWSSEGTVVDGHGHTGRDLEREDGQPGRVVEVDARPGGR
jgi:hypothetical protein